MPSIFSWRPSKFQFQLKKLSNQIGNNGAILNNDALHSSEEEDILEKKHLMSNETKNKNKIKLYDELEQQDIIVESVPSQRTGMQQLSFSDDEYFYACSPAVNRSLKFSSKALLKNDDILLDNRRRAVRFLEGFNKNINIILKF